jgi:hypothetical protein
VSSDRPTRDIPVAPDDDDGTFALVVADALMDFTSGSSGNLNGMEDDKRYAAELYDNQRCVIVVLASLQH